MTTFTLELFYFYLFLNFGCLDRKPLPMYMVIMKDITCEPDIYLNIYLI